DERRRTHDMNTANWVPDLFMQRVRAREGWTLFSPSDTPDLHDLYGKAFERRYKEYEALHAADELPGKRVEAFDLWRDMISMLYETGHPWITFKDPCNVRSPQRHDGVVHSSNLCTEITLNTKSGKKRDPKTGKMEETNDGEIAVCNLGSVNLARHLKDDGTLDAELLRKSVRTAMRMLDNVIDINYYAVGKARASNEKHRPVGLGQVGYQDCLHRMGVAFDSEEAVEFADAATEMVCYYAYEASSDLAAERGRYQSYEGSLWSQGIMPLDSLRLLAEERLADGGKIEEKDGWLRSPDLEVNVESRLDWDALRKKIAEQGMRNSNCVAIAPTATIGNIMGASPCIEPDYKILFVKSNLSGEFTIVNKFFMDDMIEAGLWNGQMLSQVKAADGEIDEIEGIPAEIRARYKTCFQLDQRWLIEAASRRQKWIDQSQSLNLFMRGLRGGEISDVYFHAWRRGLKTTYYCRTQAASKTEKYTTEGTGENNKVAVAAKEHADEDKSKAAAQCAIDNPDDCEACQ
ncbi:MAG: ribonucleoside-diphosphate reductase subunit alpha, partial [Betaproteobacteria bacterium AqS2]|nr:ribonucleoside-diphosphate reductase subunit alpha [Betaproteobacteria bacterium AqS2]